MGKELEWYARMPGHSTRYSCFPCSKVRLASLIERKDDNKSDVEYIVRASANEVKALLVFLSNRRDEVTDEKSAELTISRSNQFRRLHFTFDLAGNIALIRFRSPQTDSVCSTISAGVNQKRFACRWLCSFARSL